VNTLLVTAFWGAYLVPGLALHAAHRRRHPAPGSHPLEGLAFAFVYSSALYLPGVAAAYAVRLPTPYLAGYFWAVVVAGAAVLALGRGRGNRRRRSWWRRARLAPSPATFIFLAALACYTGVAAGVGGTEWGDAWVHVAKVNADLHAGTTYGDPFFGLDIPEARYHVTLLHPVLAVAAWSLALPATAVWAGSAAFLAALAVAAVFTTARGLTRSTPYACWAASLWTIFHVDHTDWGVQPNNVVWKIVLPLVILAAIRYLETGRRSWYLRALAGTLVIAFTHVLFAAFTAAILLVLALAQGVISGSLRAARDRPVRLALLAAIPVPHCLFTLSLPDHLQRDFSDFSRFPTYHVGGLEALLPPAGFPLLLAGLVLGLACLARRRTVPRETVVLLGVLFAVFLSVPYNPLVFPLAHQALPPWAIFRELRVLDVIGTTVAGFGVCAVTTRWLRARRPRAAVLAALLLLAVPWNLERFGHAANMLTHNDGFTRYGFLAGLAGAVPEGAVILASTADSLAIPAFLPNRVVAIPPYHANRAAPGIFRRVADAGAMLTPETPSGARARLLARYQVGFVLGRGRGGTCASFDPALFPDGVAVTASRCLFAVRAGVT